MPTIDVQLSKLDELFQSPTPDPLHGRFHEMSGIDRLIDHLASASGAAPDTLLVRVAEADPKPFTNLEIRTAIAGYCDARIAVLDRERRAIGRQGHKELIFGIVVLTGLLVLAAVIESLLPDSPDALHMVLPEGLVIVAWIALWNPVDKLLFARWPLQRETTYLQHIKTMNVIVEYAQPG